MYSDLQWLFRVKGGKGGEGEKERLDFFEKEGGRGQKTCGDRGEADSVFWGRRRRGEGQGVSARGGDPRRGEMGGKERLGKGRKGIRGGGAGESRGSWRAGWLLSLFAALSLLGSGDAYFLMGKLSWRELQAGGGEGGKAFEFRVDTVWAIDNVGLGLSGRDDFRAEIRSEWAAAVQQGPGALLPVPVTSILLGDGSSLPGQGGLLRLNVTRVDAETVHASLMVTRVYNASLGGTLNVSFEGCCRPPWALNNPGMPFRLSAGIPLEKAGNSALLSSPVIAMHPIVQLRGSEEAAGSPGSTDHFVVAASSSRGDSLAFRMAIAGEMGEGVEANQPEFSLPQGVALSSDGGIVSADTSLSSCPATGRCVRQISVIVTSGNSTSSALDFLIEIVRAGTNLHAPVADYSVFLATPETTPTNPAQIDCRNGEVALPSFSAYLVSECIDLADSASFPCDSYMGVCPPMSYVYVPPFNGPKYIRCPHPRCPLYPHPKSTPSVDAFFLMQSSLGSRKTNSLLVSPQPSCFSQKECSPGLHRLYCTRASSQSAAESSMRVSFHEQDAGQTLSRIVPSATPPMGVTLSPFCETAGDCIGGSVDSASTKFVDISWKPDCGTQLGRFIFVIFPGPPPLAHCIAWYSRFFQLAVV